METLRLPDSPTMAEPHTDEEALARAVALAQLRHLRAAPKAEWDRLHVALISKARAAGASYNEIVLACTPGE